MRVTIFLIFNWIYLFCLCISAGYPGCGNSLLGFGWEREWLAVKKTAENLYLGFGCRGRFLQRVLLIGKLPEMPSEAAGDSARVLCVSGG